MSRLENPCFSVAVARFDSPELMDHFACWVCQAPYPGGSVHRDCRWHETLYQICEAWLEMFSPQSLKPPAPASSVTVSVVPHHSQAEPALLRQEVSEPSYSSRLMQNLGLSLWNWLFDGPIKTSFYHSQGIAQGQTQPLRLRLDVREPSLIALPWEIMQPQPGQPALSLSSQVFFSRTTYDVAPLPPQQPAQSLNILLVLGENFSALPLNLEAEAKILNEILLQCGKGKLLQPGTDSPVPCYVQTLVQPTSGELMGALETHSYNILFYAGHGMPAPGGGLLLLSPDETLNGTELAQVLVGAGIKLAVFNACWGAQPALVPETGAPIPRSSLAEVLIHHGVPAVLAMRDTITDEEAHRFIQAFTQALTERASVDQAVMLARQQLLTLYKFNQPAWTLPVLYMHPQFNGELVQSWEELRTELPPQSETWLGKVQPRAYLRLLGTRDPLWSIETGKVKVGRQPSNDVVVSERWVSQEHAEIFCRNGVPGASPPVPTYFLRDHSRYGTLIWVGGEWQRVHHQEIALTSGTQLKFGSSQGQTFEFLVETMPPLLSAG